MSARLARLRALLLDDDRAAERRALLARALAGASGYRF